MSGDRPPAPGHTWPRPGASDHAWSQPGASDHAWLDGEAGPVVRPYAMTRGRVRPAAGGFDLVSFVRAKAPPNVYAQDLEPEHRAILAVARDPMTVADLAARLDLALGVVRVLLGDLLRAGYLAVYQPPPLHEMTNENVLRAVIDGLRAL